MEGMASDPAADPALLLGKAATGDLVADPRASTGDLADS